MLVVLPSQSSPVEITPQVRVPLDGDGDRLAVPPRADFARVEATAARSPGTAWLRDREDALTASSLPGHVGDHPWHAPRKSAERRWSWHPRDDSNGRYS